MSEIQNPFIYLGKFLFKHDLAGSSTEVSFKVYFVDSEIGDYKITGAAIDLNYDYTDVTDASTLSPTYIPSSGALPVTVWQLNVANLDGGVKGVIYLGARLSEANPILTGSVTIDEEDQITAGLVYNVTMTVDGLVDRESFPISFGTGNYIYVDNEDEDPVDIGYLVQGALWLENNFDPLFFLSDIAVNLDEDAAAATISGALVTALDQDGDAMRYYLVDAPVDEEELPLFSINASTGQISLTDAGAAVLNYEDDPSYELTVKAVDGTIDEDGCFVPYADAVGDEVTATVTINLVDKNDAPTSTQISNATIAEDASFSLNVTGNFSDEDAGDVLVFTAKQVVDGSEVALPSWLGFSAKTKSFSGTPTNSDVGTITVKVTATDGAGDTSSSTFTITVTNVNDAPVLDVSASPAVTQTEGDGAPSGTVGTLVSSLVSGVTDVDSGAVKGIAIVAASATNGTWYYSIDNGTSWTELGSVAEDEARLIAVGSGETAGRVYFHPSDADYAGTVASGLTIRAWDATSGNNGETADLSVSGSTGSTTAFSSATDTVSVTVTNVNDTPVITVGSGDSKAAAKTEVNDALTASGTLTVADADVSDTVTATVESVVVDGDAGSLANATLADMLSVEKVDGKINWSFNSGSEAFNHLDYGDTLTLTYMVRATDDSSSAAYDEETVTITITGTNDVPTVTTALTDQDVAEDEAFSYTLPSATFSDADAGDSLGYTAVLVDGEVGESPLAGSWLSFTYDEDAEEWKFTGTPTNSNVGTYTVKVTATDTNSAAVSDMFTITVANVNDAPVITVGSGDSATAALTEAGVDDGTGETIAGSPLSASGTMSVLDVDAGDTVTLTVESVSVSGITDGLGSVEATLKGMLDVALSSGKISWVFNSGYEAFDYLAAGEELELTYTVKATDNSGAGDTETVAITVTGTNDAPVINGEVKLKTVYLADFADGNGDFNDGDLDGWSKTSDGGSGEVTVSTGKTIQAGSNNWVIDPDGSMAVLNALGGYTDFNESFQTVTKASATTKQWIIDTFKETSSMTPTNFAAITTDFMAEAGETFTISWNYVSTDYTPFNDGSVMTLVKLDEDGNPEDTTYGILDSIEAQVVILGATNPGTGSYSTNSYGSTGWQVSTVVIQTTGTYRLGLSVFNLGDTVLSPYLFVDDIAGTTTKNGTSFAPIPPDENAPDPAGNVVEKGAITEGSAIYSLTGFITFADIDKTDAPVPSLEGSWWSVSALKADKTTVLDLTEAQKQAIAGGVGGEGGFSITPADGNTNNGIVNWTYATSEGILDFLAAGEVVTAVFTVTVTDDADATDTSEVTVTITGANDAPVITVETNDIAAETLQEKGETLSASGTLSVSDVDVTDTVSVQVYSVTAGGASTGLASNNSALMGMLTVDSGNVITSTATSGAVNWAFNSASEHFSYLGLTETLTLTYVVKVTDSNGGTDTQNVVISISGDNSAPVITSGPDTASLPETDAKLATSGTLTVTDVDRTDVVTATTSVVVSGTAAAYSETPGNDALKSMLTLSPTSVLSSSQTTNTLNWSFDSGTTKFDYLGKGETLILTYTVTVADDNTNALSDTETVTITITGTNDTPTITNGPDTAALTETDTTLTATGGMAVTDLDTTDTVAVTVDSVTVGGSFITGGRTLPSALSASSYSALKAMLSLSVDSGEIDWTFTSGVGGDNAFNFLRKDETLVLTYTVKATDDSGASGSEESASTTSTVTVTITGTNDAPAGQDKEITISEDGAHIFTAADFGFSDTADGNQFAGVLITTLESAGALQYYDTEVSAWTDVTTDQVVDASGIAAGHLKFVPMANANGNDYATFSFKVVDDGGGATNTATVANTITIDVTPVNDDPVIVAPDAETTDEHTQVVFKTPSEPQVQIFGYSATPVAADPITVSDPDSSDTILTVTVWVGVGTLSVDGAEDSPVHALDEYSATEGSQLQFKGTAAQINAVLEGLTYSPVPNGSEEVYTVDLNIVTSDGFSMAQETVKITVEPVDDPPVSIGMMALVGPGSVQTFDEFTPEWSDPEGHQAVALQILTSPGQGIFETKQVDGSGEYVWESVAAISEGNPLVIEMDKLVDYRYNATGVESGSVVNVQWKVVTAATPDDPDTWKPSIDPATGYITVVSDEDNNAPEVFLSAGSATVAEDGSTSLTMTVTDDYTPEQFLPFFFSSGNERLIDGNGVEVTSKSTVTTWTLTVTGDATGGLTFSESSSDVTLLKQSYDVGTDTYTLLVRLDADDVVGTDWLSSSGSMDGLTVSVPVVGSASKFELVLTPKADAYGTATLQLGSFDGELLNGSPVTGTEAFTLTVSPVNETPLSQLFLRALDEDADFLFSTVDPTTLYSDVHDANANANVDPVTLSSTIDIQDAVDASLYPAYFAIKSLPGHGGKLFLNNEEVTLTDSMNYGGSQISVKLIAIADLAGLVYRPADNYVGTDSFEWFAIDQAPVDGASGLYTSVKTATFTMAAVNDAPVLSDTALSMTLAEDAAAPSGAVGTLVSTFVGGVTDVDSGAVKGIAIVGAGATNGTWYYSTNNGTNWMELGTVGEATARLIEVGSGATAGRVYFKPAADYNGTVDAGLEIRAWDTTTGTNGGTVDLSGDGSTGLTTAYSAATDTVSVTVTAVNDAPVGVADPGLMATEDKEETFDASDLLGNDTDADSDVLTISSVTSDSHGQAFLNEDGDVVFIPEADYAGEATFTYIATDGNGGYTDATTVTVTVANVNDTPVITVGSGDSQAAAKTEANDALTASGTLTVVDADVSDTVTVSVHNVSANGDAGSLTDDMLADMLSVEKVEGKINWSFDSGSEAFNHLDYGDELTLTYTVRATDDSSSAAYDEETVTITITGTNDTPTANANVLADQSASQGEKFTYALPSGAFSDLDADDTLTYSASIDYGEQPGSAPQWLSFGLVDGSWQFSGTPFWQNVGHEVAVTVTATDSHGATVESSEFTIGVINTNDAPVLDTTKSPVLTGISEDVAAADNQGTLVSQLINEAVTDEDGSDVIGIYVTAVDTAHGSWEYLLAAEPSEWLTIDFTEAHSGKSLLLAPDAMVRFVPGADWHGSATLTFGAWDGYGDGEDGAYVEVAGTGFATAYSYATDTAAITVLNVNDAPVVNSAVTATLTSIGEDTAAPSGATVSALFSSYFSDETDGSAADSFTGVAVVGYTANASAGAWQYSTDGSAWSTIGTVSDASALTLAATAKLRFTPVTNWNGTAPSLTVRLLETGATISGAGVDVSTNGGTSTISYGTVTLSTEVTAVNDAPTVTAGEQSATIVEAGGVNNGTAGTSSATITLTKADVDSTVNYDLTWLTENGWSTNDEGLTYTKTGTYGTATLTVSSGVVSYALADSDTSTQALASGASVSDTFTVQVTDGSLTSQATASFAITGANDAPTVTAGGQSATIVEAGGVNNGTSGTSSATIALTKADVDSTVSYDPTWLTGNGWSTNDEGLTYTKTGTYGTATLTVSTGVVSYVLSDSDTDTQPLKAGASVSETFTVQVTDGSLTSQATASFAITGANDAPTVTAGGQSATIVEAGGVNNGTSGTSSATIALTKADVDADTVDYDANWLSTNWSTNDEGLTYTKTGTYGTATLTVSTGVVSYVLDNSDTDTQALASGVSVSDAFTMQVTDGSLTSQATASFAITGANDAPSGTADSFSIDEETVGWFGTLLDNDTDPEGNSLSIASVAMATGHTSDGTVSIGANGVVKFTPAADFSGTTSFTYTATDGTTPSSPVTVTVEVVGTNDAPTTSLVTLDKMGINNPVRTITAADLLVEADDVDGDTLTVSNLSVSGGGTLEQEETGVWEFTRTSDQPQWVSFNYTITDNGTTGGVADHKSVAGSAILEIVTGYSLSAVVGYYNETISDLKPIAGVGFELTNEVTDSDGIVVIPNMAGPETLAPSLAYNSGNDEALGLPDALLILKKATISGTVLSDAQLLAADYNRDGNINAFDALQLLRYRAGLESVNPAWIFADSSADMPISVDVTTTGQVVGVIGILSGDVDGTWAPAYA